MLKVITAFVLDLIFGDPHNYPHPVRIIGHFISILERKLINFRNKKISGFILTVIVVISSYFAALLISSINILLELFLIYTIFSAGALAFEGKKIYKSLLNGDIEKARYNLSFIVSRDTSKMNKDDIIRSTVETVSENIVDGVISPLFYLLIGGVPLAMAFKATSTLDSMIGYKNKKYKDFGYASAKLDDILNFIPARITGFVLIPAASLLCGKNFINSFKIVARDRLKHDSPNSAHAESAIAGALGLRLGGKNIYFNKSLIKPFIGDKLKQFELNDINDAIRIMYVASVIALIAGVIIKFIIIKYLLS
jgi:adenosylcobinamide-phosphate synthase